MGSTVTQPPTDLAIAFTEAAEPRFSSTDVTNVAAQRLVVAVQELPPGIYTVAWHATSVDTHKTDGIYHFTVAATDASGITLEHIWARARAGKTSTCAAYLTVTDNSTPDRLVGVSTPAAAAAELHETINENGVMKMRSVAAIVRDPDKPVTLSPGGYHVMLMGLKSPLKAGDSFPLPIAFEHAQPITVTVKVEAVGASGMEHDHGAMGSMPGQMGHTP